MIAFPEIISDNYEEKVEKKFHSKQANQRHKLDYILAGAGGGLYVSFFGSFLLSLFSRFLFNGPTFFWHLSRSFLISQFVIAPVKGGFFGFWLGKNKSFKRPEPEWTEQAL